MSVFQTFLSLSRYSHLPTVWSNCLAGWWLGGGRRAHELPWIMAGATFLYLGGAFLNDAFDADYDRQHRAGRPIPAGSIRPDTVWRWGLAWLVVGALLLLRVGPVTGAFGMALVACIILHHTVHKLIEVGPLLSGLCRFFLYVIGASAGGRGITGWSLWCGLAVAAYVAGVGYTPRQKHTKGIERYWPALLMLAPIMLALIMNAGPYREGALLLSAVLALWLTRCLRHAFGSAEPNSSLGSPALVAGIVLADWLAVVNVPYQMSFLFIALFLSALLLQRLELRLEQKSPKPAAQ